MAAPNVESQKSDSNESKTNDAQGNIENITIPEPTQAVLEKISKEMAELYQYKCKHQLNKNGSVTFWPTPNCKPSPERMKTEPISMDTIIGKENCKSAAAYSNPGDEIVNTGARNSFIVSSLTAWSQHYPFRFRAEHIWLLVLQSVAVHVDQNAEKLRDKYVTHEGKKTLEIEVSPNPSAKEWMSVIQGFVQQIDANTVKDTCALFDCDFTTSTLTEKIATKVTIMDICKNYFEYRCSTCCGFPQITLDGTKEDWVRLKQKVIKLLSDKVDKKFGAQWGDAILPLLDRFIVAFDGNIDGVFWNSMIKRGSTGGSGGYSWYSGWFNILFPFINKRWNRFCEAYSMDKSYVAQGLNGWGRGRGQNDQMDYPMGLATAPVTWDYNGKEIPMKFIAGFVGYTQDKNTLEIAPNVGWCVAYSMSEKEIAEKQSKSRYRW